EACHLLRPKLEADDAGLVERDVTRACGNDVACGPLHDVGRHGYLLAGLEKRPMGALSRPHVGGGGLPIDARSGAGVCCHGITSASSVDRPRPVTACQLCNEGHV